MPALKLNLKALHSDKEEKKSILPSSEEDQPIEPNNTKKVLGKLENISPSIQKDIDISNKIEEKLRTQKSDQRIEEKEEKEEKEEEEEEYITDEDIDIVEKERTDIEALGKEKTGIYSFSLPKKQKSQKQFDQETLKFIEEEKSAAQALEDEKNKIPKENIKFQNYESSFSKQGNHIIKKMRNFKYTPKTRVGFVIGLMGITFGTLGILMILFPEKHSIEVYKASILNIYHEEKAQKINLPIENSDEYTTPLDTTNSELLLEEEATTITSENIPEEIPQEKTQKQKERLRKHLIEKYSK